MKYGKNVEKINNERNNEYKVTSSNIIETASLWLWFQRIRRLSHRNSTLELFPVETQSNARPFRRSFVVSIKYLFIIFNLENDLSSALADGNGQRESPKNE